jgi:hypothetical protein
MDIQEYCETHEEETVVVGVDDEEILFVLPSNRYMLVNHMLYNMGAEYLFIDKSSLSLDDYMQSLSSTELVLHMLGEVHFDWHWNSNGNGSKEYVGRLPVRMAKFMKKTFDIKLSDNVKALLGEHARRHMIPTSGVPIDFVCGATWDAGDYGDDSSCFWNERNGVGRRLTEGKVWAARYYESDHPTRGDGRAWFLPGYIKPEYALAFNFYGSLHSEQFTALLVSHFTKLSGVKYAAISEHMSNCCENCEFWYNRDAVVFLPESDVDTFRAKRVCLDGATSNWVHSDAVKHPCEYYHNESEDDVETCDECGCELDWDGNCTCANHCCKCSQSINCWKCGDERNGDGNCVSTNGCSLSVVCQECGCNLDYEQCVCTCARCHCTLSVYNCDECGHELEDDFCTNEGCSLCVVEVTDETT